MSDTVGNELATLTKSMAGILPYRPARNCSFHKVTYRNSRNEKFTVVCEDMQVQESMITLINVRVKKEFTLDKTFKAGMGVFLFYKDDNYAGPSTFGKSLYDFKRYGYTVVHAKTMIREFIEDIESFEVEDYEDDGNSWWNFDEEETHNIQVEELFKHNKSVEEKTIESLSIETLEKAYKALEKEARNLAQWNYERKNWFIRLVTKTPDYDSVPVEQHRLNKFIKKMENIEQKDIPGLDLTNVYKVFGEIK